MTIIGGEDGEVDHYVSDYFSVVKFKATYAENVHALLGKDQWTIVDQGFKLHAPVLTRPAGRPRKNRIIASSEGGVRKSRKCKRCGQLGHIARLFTNPVDPSFGEDEHQGAQNAEDNEASEEEAQDHEASEEDAEDHEVAEDLQVAETTVELSLIGTTTCSRISRQKGKGQSQRKGNKRTNAQVYFPSTEGEPSVQPTSADDFEAMALDDFEDILPYPDTILASVTGSTPSPSPEPVHEVKPKRTKKAVLQSNPARNTRSKMVNQARNTRSQKRI